MIWKSMSLIINFQSACLPKFGLAWPFTVYVCDGGDSPVSLYADVSGFVEIPASIRDPYV